MSPAKRALVVCIAVVWPLVVEPLDTTRPSAVARVRATLEAAAKASPALLAELAERDRRAAAEQASATTDPATLEWQREGIGGWSSREPNSQDVIRLAKPVRYPGQATAARSLRQAAEASRAEGWRASSLLLLSQVAASWLEVAALSDRVAIVDERWQRLDEALALQEARYQLGEVSGSDVTQLDLEHVRESSRLAQLRAERDAILEPLSRLVGGQVDAPLAGDLAVLVGATRHPDPASTAAAIARAAGDGPLARELHAATSANTAQARLTARDAAGWPELEVEMERVPTIAGVPGFDAWGFRIGVPLPIGRAVREQRAAGEAAATAAERRLTAEREQLAARAGAAIARARGADERLIALRPALANLADVAHSLAEQFRLGALSYLVYIDGLSRLDEIRLDAVDARLDLLAARLELAVLLGDETLFPLPAAAAAAAVPGEEGP